MISKFLPFATFTWGRHRYTNVKMSFVT